MRTEVSEIMMMRNPLTWPMMVLPVKNYKERKPGEFPKMGILTTEEDASMTVKPVVYLNIDPQQYRTAVPHPKALEAAHKIEYKSFEALYEAGWVVD